MSSAAADAAKPKVQVKNRILLALPAPDFDRILPKLESVNLARGTVLYDIGWPIRHAYFLNAGLTSLVATAENGASVEIGIVGEEGLIGLPAVLGKSSMPCRVLVQFPATAMRIPIAALEAELEQCPRLRTLLLKYMHVLHAQVSQSVVCNRFHSLEQRFCRWLLACRDRLGSDSFPLTHEGLAHMLGSTRTPVTLIAGDLQRTGLISYHRGLIQMLDRRAIESSACECYRIVREDYENLFV